MRARDPMRNAILSLMAAWGFALAAGPALAHPHVWIVARTGIVYGPDGRVTAFDHDWTFDKAYSSFAVQGLDANGDGTTSSDELADLAKTNVESLAEFAWFTHAKANGARLGFGTPTDARLTYRDGELTLHFRLPLPSPAKADRALVLDLYDPTFFVDFRLDEAADAVRLVGAPAGCVLKVGRPKPADLANAQGLGEAAFTGLTGAPGVGVTLPNKVLVACP